MSHDPSRADLRLIIASWPDDAPRGAVSRFCREHKVSREWFYATRKHIAEAGLPEALMARSSRPRTSPAKVSDLVERLALDARVRLADEGWDNGPISVKFELEKLGIEAPSRATLARIFTRNGVVTPQPKKRPKGTFISFEYAAPNEMWQLDATDYTLAGGIVVAIFQLNDDHARFQIASLAARSENAEDAVRVVTIGMTRHGIPQRLLTDNGTALNPIRRGWIGELTALMRSLGVQAIASSVAHPQTQGKNERGHSTLNRWLAARPAANDLEELQLLLDQFDRLYNEHRPHQSLAMKTPHERYFATPKAPAPSPPLLPETEATPAKPHHHVRQAADTGVLTVAHMRIQLGRDQARRTFTVIVEADNIHIFDAQGTHVVTHRKAPKGTYVGNGKPRGFLATQITKTPPPTEPSATS
jgi:putative transposase